MNGTRIDLRYSTWVARRAAGHALPRVLTAIFMRPTLCWLKTSLNSGVDGSTEGIISSVLLWGVLRQPAEIFQTLRSASNYGTQEKFLHRNKTSQLASPVDVPIRARQTIVAGTLASDVAWLRDEYCRQRGRCPMNSYDKNPSIVKCARYHVRLRQTQNLCPTFLVRSCAMTPRLSDAVDDLDDGRTSYAWPQQGDEAAIEEKDGGQGRTVERPCASP